MWLIIQSLVIFAVVASNIHWQWTAGHLLGRDEVKGKGSCDTERHGNGGGPPLSGVAAECNSNQGRA